ncbi:carboxypeptidase regulatory-like domain-containing protein [Streptomyces sp. NPDC048197]|uniref:carboxypeptidase regulatory-like domain-containing protein n=1 Tax=Streptomyces sp. NPDC048197 TaxID=3365511 RepID=UPI00371573A4
MHGHVRTINGNEPIRLIQVSVYRRDLSRMKHVYTDDEGRYDVEIPSGESVTVRFDTHPTLNNAEDWQPSVVSNVVADNDVPLDRCLLRSGQDADPASAVDALGGYLFAAALSDAEAEGEAGYAATARARLSRLKQHTQALQEFQERLHRYFSGQA